MGHQRTHVILPEALIADIDAFVGQRKRSAFLAEVAARELRRRRLLAALASDKPAWKSADHPDIEQAGGAAAWVKKLRREWDRASKRRSRPKRG